MKKLNKKGFTLIELLAVIVIMGILMMVAIPAMQRYINNSRKETYVNTVKKYVEAVDTAYAADELSCSGETGYFNISFTEAKKLLKSGGTSPYGGGALYGYIGMNVDSNGKVTYIVGVSDAKKNGYSRQDVSTMTKGNLQNGVVPYTSTSAVSNVFTSYYASSKSCTVN